MSADSDKFMNARSLFFLRLGSRSSGHPILVDRKALGNAYRPTPQPLTNRIFGLGGLSATELGSHAGGIDNGAMVIGSI